MTYSRSPFTIIDKARQGVLTANSQPTHGGDLTTNSQPTHGDDLFTASAQPTHGDGLLTKILHNKNTSGHNQNATRKTKAYSR